MARLCQKLHPDATVILGELTDTIFHEEIILNMNLLTQLSGQERKSFFLLLMRVLKQHQKPETLSNLTCKDEEDKIISVPLMEPVADLDEFEFTGLDLLKTDK